MKNHNTYISFSVGFIFRLVRLRIVAGSSCGGARLDVELT